MRTQFLFSFRFPFSQTEQKPFILQAFNLQTNKSNYLFIDVLNYAALFNVSAVLNLHDCFKILLNTSLSCDCLERRHWAISITEKPY